MPVEQAEQGQQLLELAGDGFDELRLWDVDRGLGARADDSRDRLAIFSIAREADAVIVDCNGRVIDPSKELQVLPQWPRGGNHRQRAECAGYPYLAREALASI